MSRVTCVARRCHLRISSCLCVCNRSICRSDTMLSSNCSAVRFCTVSLRRFSATVSHPFAVGNLPDLNSRFPINQISIIVIISSSSSSSSSIIIIIIVILLPHLIIVINRFDSLEIGVHLYLDNWFTCMFAKARSVSCLQYH